MEGTSRSKVKWNSMEIIEQVEMRKNRDLGYSLALTRRENHTWKCIWTALPKNVTGSLRSLINGQIAFKFRDSFTKLSRLALKLTSQPRFWTCPSSCLSCIARITNLATWPVYKASLWNLQNLCLLIWLSSYFLLYFLVDRWGKFMD